MSKQVHSLLLLLPALGDVTKGRLALLRPLTAVCDDLPPLQSLVFCFVLFCLAAVDVHVVFLLNM